MRAILSQRPLRFVFAANLISMLGSGMNSAAVAWYILQATHSEQALGTLAVVQTIPAMLMLPFTGVIIDREDRRRLVMWLDAVRAVIIAVVAMLAFRHRVQVWELYLMNTLVAAGFWMFWPTITALIQELTPEDRFVHSNTFLLAGVQGGWLIAGSFVGFMYNHIGLGGVLFIDVSTYVVSQRTPCRAAPPGVASRPGRGGKPIAALLARSRRGTALSARSSGRGDAGDQLGSVSRSHDDGRSGDSFAE
jgi:MFS family permease